MPRTSMKGTRDLYSMLADIAKGQQWLQQGDHIIKPIRYFKYPKSHLVSLPNSNCAGAPLRVYTPVDSASPTSFGLSV